MSQQLSECHVINLTQYPEKREKDKQWKFLRNWGNDISREDENLSVSHSSLSSSFRVLEGLSVNHRTGLNRLLRSELLSFFLFRKHAPK